MPQSSPPNSKMAEDILSDLEQTDDAETTAAYFGAAVQSIWSAVISMVETQRRMTKQLHTLRQNYNRLLDTTDAMLNMINSPHENPLYHKKPSNAAQILIENSESVGRNIISPQSTSPTVSIPKFNRVNIPKGDGADKNIQNLWKRK